MLEVLPPGASKGHGVEVLLKHLGIDSLHLMALGESAPSERAAYRQEWKQYVDMATATDVRL